MVNAHNLLNSALWLCASVVKLVLACLGGEEGSFRLALEEIEQDFGIVAVSYEEVDSGGLTDFGGVEFADHASD